MPSIIKDTHVCNGALSLTCSTDSNSAACVRGASRFASRAFPVLFFTRQRHVHKVRLDGLSAQKIGQNLLLIHFWIGANITGVERLIFGRDDLTVSVIGRSSTKPFAANWSVALSTALRIKSEVRPSASAPIIKCLGVNRCVIQLAVALHVNHLPRQKPEAEIDTCNEEVQNDSDLLEVFPFAAARALFLPVVALEVIIVLEFLIRISIRILIRLHDEVCVVPADALPEFLCLFFSDARPPL